MEAEKQIDTFRGREREKWIQEKTKTDRYVQREEVDT